MRECDVLAHEERCPYALECWDVVSARPSMCATTTVPSCCCCSDRFAISLCLCPSGHVHDLHDLRGRTGKVGNKK
jgi:hypothetical protein